VRRVIHVLTQHIRPEELLVAAKVEFDPGLTTGQLVEAINACEQRVRAGADVGAARIYIEPDVGARETIREAGPPPPA
jgi:divalent metal cation (Fe/Co/Zn/Cd) transporter